MKNCVMLLLLATTVPAAAQKKADRKTLENLQTTVHFLAADSLEGRLAGTPGELRAAAYISRQMQQDGLIPKGDSGYAQVFTIKDVRETAPTAQLVINDQTLTPNEHFFALPFSATKAAKGDVIPHVNEPGNVWLINLASQEIPAAALLTNLRKQATEAAKAGANAIVFYNGKITPAQLEKWGSTDSKAISIPALWVSETASKKWMGDEVEGFNVNLQVAFTRVRTRAMNVAGFIDNGVPQTVVIGARYDFRGKNAPQNEEYASAVAALLELGHQLKASKLRNNNYLLVAFSAQEQSLPGAQYFAQHALVDSSSLNYLIDVNHIGNLSADNPLMVSGAHTSPAWEKLVADAAKNVLTKTDTALATTDRTFYQHGLPVLSFYTTAHDTDKVNYNGTLDIVKMIYSIIEKANTQGKLAFTPATEK